VSPCGTCAVSSGVGGAPRDPNSSKHNYIRESATGAQCDHLIIIIYLILSYLSHHILL
jgi:hypothetical protein